MTKVAYARFNINDKLIKRKHYWQIHTSDYTKNDHDISVKH